MSSIDVTCTELLRLCALLSGAKEHARILGAIVEAQEHVREIERLFKEIEKHLAAIEAKLRT